MTPPRTNRDHSMTTRRTNRADSGEDGDRCQHPLRDCLENTGGFTAKPTRNDASESSGWDTDWASRNSLSLEDLAPPDDASDRGDSSAEGDADSQDQSATEPEVSVTVLNLASGQMHGAEGTL